MTPPPTPSRRTLAPGRSFPGRTLLGALLAALALLPLWRILPARDTGLAGRATAEIVSVQLSLLWSAFALVLAGGLLLGLFLSGDAPERVGARVGRGLLRPPGGGFALAAGLAAFTATALTSVGVFGGRLHGDGQGARGLQNSTGEGVTNRCGLRQVNI